MLFRRVFGQVFGLETAIAAVVFALVMMAMVVAFLASWRRRRRGAGPSARAKNDPLEIGYVLGLTGMAVFLIVTSLSANATESTDPPASLTVEVTAFQWCWQFHYAGQPVTVTGRCAGGSIPTLVLPAGRRVRLELASKDVIHSFWLPGLRYKIDVYPGHVNAFTMTLPDGRWLGRCAEFCGLYHYGMMFNVQAVPPAQFGRWLRARGGSAAAVSAR